MTVRGIQSWHFKMYIISLGLTLMIPLQVFTLHTGCVQEAGMTLCWCEQGSVWSASMCNSLGPCFLHSASAQGKSPCACVRQSPPDSERCLPATQASSSAGHADPVVRCHGGVPNGALARKEKGEFSDGCGEDSSSGAEEFQGIRRHGEGIITVDGGRERDVHHAEGAAFVGGVKEDGDNRASIVQAERDSVDFVPPRKGHDDVRHSREDRIVPLEGDRVLEAKGEEGRNVNLSDASINEGANVTLTMAEPEVAPESVMWWSNDTVVVNGSVFTLGVAPGKGPTLTIKGINKKHQGVYSCEACVGTVLVKGSVTLPIILAVPVVDIEQSSLPQISVACSEPTTLTCCLTSLEGNMTVTWKNETVQTSSVTASSLCSTYKATISNPCQDTVYTCTFSNEVGATSYAIAVYYIPTNDKTCPSNDPWPETKRNGVAHVRCPPGYRGTALRRCSADGVWGAIFKNCTSNRFTNVEGKVQLMEDGIGNPTELVPQLLAEMKTITQVPEPSSQEQTLLMGDVRSAHASLDKIIHVASARDVRFNKNVSKDFLDSASNLLDGSVKESWSQLEFMGSMDSSSLLQTTEDFTHLIDAEEFFSSARTLGSKKSREDFNLSSSNILMAGSLYRAAR